jgi:hypothetical protein
MHRFWNLPLTIAVRLHVTSSSLDKWRSNIGVRRSQNFVANEKSAKIVVVVEGIHDFLVSLVLSLVPLRCGHARSLDVRVESVQIKPDVDTGVGKSLHAVVVLGLRINMVNADGVGTESLHQVRVEGALGVVDKWVLWQELVGHACRGN